MGPEGGEAENHDKFIRGNANGDNSTDISDVILILNFLFTGGAEPSCLDAADVNDDSAIGIEKIDITDAIYLLGHLFLGGSAPPAPFPLCGLDLTADDLTCTTALCDNDGDGLNNADERQRGTDPDNTDTDNDSFTGAEEVLPIGVDGFNISAAPWMANPLKPDVFVEIDWYDYQGTINPHHNHKPQVPAMNAVVTAFNNASVATIVNGVTVSTGIALHLDYGQHGGQGGNAVVWHDEIWQGTDPEILKEEYMAPNQSGDCVFCGTLHAVKFDAARGNFDPLRNKVFHYSLWGHILFLDGYSAGGWAQAVPHENFAVTLGHPFWGDYDADRDGLTWNTNGDMGDRILVEGGVFMHELGHTLGLFHGGFADAFDCKPNYDSVMNYRYIIRGVDENCDWMPSRTRLDYSRAQFADLNEASLSEPTGMCGTPIDWNRDQDTTDNPVAPPLDVNNDNDLAALPGEESRCSGNGQIQDGPLPDDLLRGFDDWTFIQTQGMGSPRLIPPGFWTPTVPCMSPGNCAGGGAGGTNDPPCLLQTP